jgi:cellulose synthase/poly-beta-1,6-N-acetylglucosamine synthase-like glycosyltransferase
MLIVTLVCLFLLSCYTALILLYRMGWERQQGFKLPAGYKPRTLVSIIVPARNEENNITACLNSLLAQTYPANMFEVIVIDDHSTDNTVAAVKAFKQSNVKLLRLADFVKEGDETNSYKKKALTAGINQSKGELIITTDADCTAGSQWLMEMVARYESQKPVMIIAPVDFTSDGSLVQLFQSLDFMSMQGITVATHQLGLGNMCNGANFAFQKKAFEAVNGYDGIDHLASGDDYLLMMKLQKAFPGNKVYLKSKNAIMHTAPQPDAGSFLQQRIRWASKSGKYDDKKMTATLLLVYLFNLSFLVLALMGFNKGAYLVLSGCMLLVKIVAELIFLYPVAKFFNKKSQLLFFPVLQPLHIAYIIIAGLLGFVGKYTWKGRDVK